MDAEDKIRHVTMAYTKRVSRILSLNKENLQSGLKEFIWNSTLAAKIPECVNLKNTWDIIARFIAAYELAARGIDVEEGFARRTRRKVKSVLNIDTSAEWERVRVDIETKIDSFTEQELVVYLINRYGVIGTGGFVVEEPLSDKGLENEVKWIIYVAAIVLNKVVKEGVGDENRSS